MRKLTPLPEDSHRLLRTVTGSRRKSEAKTWLLEHLDRIDQAYDAYRHAEDEPVGLPPWTTDTTSIAHQAMQSNWTSLDNAVTADIKPAILQRSALCALCGDQQAGQIDHYLPKAIYPEFAILLDNLAPACGRCNHLKSDRVGSAGGALFLHPYRSRLPAERWLTARLVIVEDVLIAEFTVQRTPSMGQATFELLTRHFDALRLADLYGTNAVTALAELRQVCVEDFASGGAAAVQQLLRKLARSAARPHAVNHWRPTLLEALTDSAWFCAGGFVHIPDSELLGID